MTTSDRLREQIDCCRSDSSDPALPELAELAAAVKRDRTVADELALSQRLDARVREALLDVPIPAGLAERLLAAAASQVDGELACVTNVNSAPTAGRLGRLVGRRQLLLVGGSLAAALLLAVSAFLFARRSQRVVTRQELAEAATAWIGQAAPGGGSWSTAPLRGVAIDPGLKRGVIQWQAFDFTSPHGWSAHVTAMELSPSGQPRAVLFAVRTAARFDVTATPMPTWRLMMSGGYRATAWQRNSSELLYVLVVKEDGGQQLEHFLRTDTHA